MAALLIGHSFHTKNISVPPSRPTSRIHISLACQSRKPIDSPDPKTKKGKGKENKHWILRLPGVVEKVGRELKDNLSPKQKGDWKDLMLMSFSFAVYVYISQKIVCAYCAWMSMIK